MVQFSHADNIRTIPSLVDGLRPGQVFKIYYYLLLFFIIIFFYFYFYYYLSFILIIIYYYYYFFFLINFFFQRKVLHACLKRNLNKEIKVSQLSGYVRLIICICYYISIYNNKYIRNIEYFL